MLRWTPEAHAEDLHQTKKSEKWNQNRPKKLGEHGFKHAAGAWICSPGANLHFRSLSLIFFHRDPKVREVAGGCESRERNPREREWGEEMSRLDVWAVADPAG